MEVACPSVRCEYRQNITRQKIQKAILEKRGGFKRNASQLPKKRVVSSGHVMILRSIEMR